jgi:hypothetical protein
MHHIRVFLSKECDQCLQGLSIKHILIVRPVADHLKAVDGNSRPGEPFCQWTWTRADHFHLDTRLAQSLDKVEDVTFSAANHRVPDDLHDRKWHDNSSLKNIL